MAAAYSGIDTDVCQHDGGLAPGVKDPPGGLENIYLPVNPEYAPGSLQYV
jgi:hypothetical protein